MEIEEYKEINRGALVSSFNIIIKEWGMTIRNCTWFEKDNHSWLSFPSRSYDDPETGKKKYFSFILFEEKVKVKFESAVREELKKFKKQEVPQEEVCDFFEQEEVPF